MIHNFYRSLHYHAGYVVTQEREQSYMDLLKTAIDIISQSKLFPVIKIQMSDKAIAFGTLRDRPCERKVMV